MADTTGTSNAAVLSRRRSPAAHLAQVMADGSSDRLRLLEVLCMEPPQGLNLDEDSLEDYLGNNIARMIGLEPTPAPKTVAEAKALLTPAA